MQKMLAGLVAAAGAIVVGTMAAPVLADQPQYYIPPQYKHQVKPVYPESARVAHETGTVFVKVLVMSDGSIAKKGGITLFKSSGHSDLDNAVLAALRQTTFKPATRNGKPVVAFKDVQITFNLKGIQEAGGNTSDLARKLQANPRDVATRLKLATGYLNKQDFASAESVLKDGTSLDAGNATLWARLGIAYYGDAVQTKSNDKYRLASEAFDKAIAANPHVDTKGVAPVAYTSYAINLILTGDFSTALSYAEKAAQLDPKRADTQIAIGQANAGLGNYQAAISAFKTAQQLDNHKNASISALILTFIGQSYFKLGNEAEGVAYIRQAESVDAHNPRPYQALAQYYLQKGNATAALGPLRQVEAINPHDALVKSQIAEVYTIQKNYPAAKAELDAAMAIEPNNSRVLFAQAELAAFQGDAAGADAYLQRAVAADKGSTASFNEALARIYLQQNTHTAEAERYARVATQANANNGDAWYDLGTALANEGKRTDAGDAFKKAYDLAKRSGNADLLKAATDAYKKVMGKDVTAG